MAHVEEPHIDELQPGDDQQVEDVLSRDLPIEGLAGVTSEVTSGARSPHVRTPCSLANLAPSARLVAVQLAAQLKSITEEMKRLKAELHEPNGSFASLAAQLDEMREQTEGLGGYDEDLQAGVGASSSSLQRRGGGGGDGDGGGGGGSGCGAASRRREQQPLPSSKLGGKRVEFEPGTRDPPPRAQQRRQPPLRRPDPGWTPYVVGFVMICLGERVNPDTRKAHANHADPFHIHPHRSRSDNRTAHTPLSASRLAGPLRPILWGMLKDGFARLTAGAEPDEVAWWDADAE